MERCVLVLLSTALWGRLGRAYFLGGLLSGGGVEFSAGTAEQPSCWLWIATVPGACVWPTVATILNRSVVGGWHSCTGLLS